MIWVFDIASHIQGAIVNHTCQVFWLTLTTVIFPPLQGFINFFVYTVTNRILLKPHAKKPSNNSIQGEKSGLLGYPNNAYPPIN